MLMFHSWLIDLTEKPVYLVRKNIVHREKKKYSKLAKQQWKHFPETSQK